MNKNTITKYQSKGIIPSCSDIISDRELIAVATILCLNKILWDVKDPETKGIVNILLGEAYKKLGQAQRTRNLYENLWVSEKEICKDFNVSNTQLRSWRKRRIFPEPTKKISQKGGALNFYWNKEACGKLIKINKILGTSRKISDQEYYQPEINVCIKKMKPPINAL